jgi:hypothetical protein
MVLQSGWSAGVPARCSGGVLTAVVPVIGCRIAGSAGVSPAVVQASCLRL